MTATLVLSNPLRVQLTHACLNQDLNAITAALDAGASPYEAMLMLVVWRPGFDLAVSRTSREDRDRFMQRVGANDEQRGIVRAHGMREQLRLLLP